MELSEGTAKVIRPFIYGDLVGNRAFIVAVVLLALLLMGLYKLAARVLGIGRAPRPLEESDHEAAEAEGSQSGAQASQDSGEDASEEAGKPEGDDQ